MDMYNILNDLTFIGWIGIFLMIGYPLLAIIKQDWFFTWDYRFPKWNAMEDYFYTEGMQLGFLIARFIFGWVVVFVIGRILMLL